MTPSAKRELFESSVRSTGELAGVFEHDGETGYFYLFATGEPLKILGAVHVISGPCVLEASDVEIRWAGDVVALFIAGKVWAVFEASTGAVYAGNYAAGIAPMLPARVSTALFAR